jgi:Na+/glutamate symporter
MTTTDDRKIITVICFAISLTLGKYLLSKTQFYTKLSHPNQIIVDLIWVILLIVLCFFLEIFGNILMKSEH